MVHIQPSSITKMFRTLYTILHSYFSHLSEHPDFQSSTWHFLLTTRDIASSTIQVPSCRMSACPHHNTGSWQGSGCYSRFLVSIVWLVSFSEGGLAKETSLNGTVTSVPNLAEAAWQGWRDFLISSGLPLNVSLVLSIVPWMERAQSSFLPLGFTSTAMKSGV